MFSRLLIANRGEIACRIARTAKRLGVATVGVFSDADAQSAAVRACDEAIRIGPALARDSYLDGGRILEAARLSGATAIHPGYGFLSENAAFARACAEAGVTFIGPSVEAIEAMGSKARAKALMAAAGVPLVPGYHGADQSEETLAKAAARIGYPVLIKASAGGGGKGMRVVGEAGAFAAALASARREAMAAFGDDTMLIEKYLDHPRHVEIQIFGDHQGRVVSLFERDCSLQRRHQKVIEEAPAPDLDPALRRAMAAAGVAAARALAYVGAGTVEFLYQDNAYYFIEMNTRLQVEHPVTEKITGLDLVEWQLRVAAKEPLPLTQDQITARGHAFEARIYAEDPARGFAPSTGRLLRFRPPPADGHLRIDTGVGEGDEVSVHYDPMIAKLVVWDEDRALALARLARALRAFQIIGPSTNLAFLAALADHADFAAGAVSTRFIEAEIDRLLPAIPAAPPEVLAVAGVFVVLSARREAAARARASGDPHSPWNAVNGWRLNDDNHHGVELRDGDRALRVLVHFQGDGFLVEVPGAGAALAVRGGLEADGALEIEIDGRTSRAVVLRQAGLLKVIHGDTLYSLGLAEGIDAAAEEEVGGLSAPMPGRIVAVLVAVGDGVERGQPLLVLEAMKMETTITAPAGGRISAIGVAAGDQVEEGRVLAVIEPAGEEGGKSAGAEGIEPAGAEASR
ncbi:3-methylcrotonyl-CoA carboxylase [Rhodospirillum rubrum]|uniref:acetyl/propionyl/methylcrotonyl-CoA carboxylase subunit alpha n=1 Tax=Rhodospirillum rubrum TaxID=1085 RepID=UPI001904FA32|nr:biotin carboxylase N-terminal domain-containing protein [Rhodospirillum rubrum]MBK1678081.1 3-methylcrotonyl-CoA carboxylase [Rhodospirillum rubrum]